MEKVLIFWMGDKNVADFKKKQFSKIDKNNRFEIEVGPSKEEHEILYEEVQYYRDAFDAKIYSFCSDVWRFYKLSKERAVYIDTATVVGDNFEQWFDDNMVSKTTLFKGNPYTIETGVMFSSITNNNFYKAIFDFYKNNEIDIYTFPFAPTILTKFTKAKYNIDITWDEFLNDEISIKSLLKIRDKKSLWKTSSASWWKETSSFADFEKNDRWAYWEECWNNKKVHKHWIWRYQRHVIDNEKIDVHMLRKYYDNSSSKDLKILLEAKYKEINYKMHLSEKLVWSKFYRFFKGKKWK